MRVEGSRTSARIRVALVLAVLCLLIQPTAGLAQNVTTGGADKLTIKGFIIATFFAQNQNFVFGNGQSAEFPAGDLTEDEWFLDGDLRNTRITLVWNGPDVEVKFKVGGVLEADFFGGFNGSGAFSDEQQIPRLRLAYVDVIKGKTTYRMGQAWTPLFGNVPASPTHVAFPLATVPRAWSAGASRVSTFIAICRTRTTRSRKS